MDNYGSLVDLLIKDEMHGNPQHERVLLLGETPEYLRHHASFDELTLVTTGKVIGKAHFDHGITASMLKRLPQLVNNPKCVFDPANPMHRHSVVVLTFELKGSSPIIIPIRRNVRIGRSQQFNLVTSVYGKEGPDPETKWKAENLLIWES
ncbi:MAG: hypothetical protein N0E44_07895 [Candidatus Thiodiazotropha lotti]|nr:hypothetical protein [Candidatus Thiodiazotropha lotti]MCW4219799.1 hypothetical protein [Candidatus Thiodiazotropha lotti]